MKTYRCKTCGADKPETEFPRSRGKPRSTCKPCTYSYLRAWRAANREAVLEYHANYYARNKGKNASTQ